MINDTYANEVIDKQQDKQERLPSLPFRSAPLARYRLTLSYGETYSLPRGTHEVHIRFGTARIMDGKHEFILYQGEMQEMANDIGEVSSVYGHEPVVFEMVLDANSEASQQLKRQFYERMAEHQRLIETENQNDHR